MITFGGAYSGPPLKVPKCEIFHLFDFNEFYGINFFFFFNVAQIRTILSLLAYALPTLATIFDFELAQKKVVSDPPEVHLNVSK